MPVDVSFDELSLWLSFAHLNSEVLTWSRASPSTELTHSSQEAAPIEDEVNPCIVNLHPVLETSSQTVPVVAAPVLIALATNTVSASESAVASEISPSHDDPASRKGQSVSKPLVVEVDSMTVDVSLKETPHSPTSGCTCSIH